MLQKKCLLLAAAMLLLPMGCNAEPESSVQETNVPESAAPTMAQTEEITETPTQTPTELPSEGINPLTGETGYPEAAEGKRPVAIMVSNIMVSYPQYGISDADLIFEMPVEGGLTRLMAVYADFSSVPDVCSVRSSRYYYPQIAKGLDAIYCHWGSEQTFAAETMENLDIDRLDGGMLMDSILFYRDPERVGVYASEHTGYLKGEELPDAIAKYGIREESVRTEPLMCFSDTVITAGEPCKGATLYYSNSSYTGFRYSVKAELYRMLHNGEKQMDGHTGDQVSFKNVFILQTEVSSLQEDGYLKSVALSGGSGYYLTMGTSQSIRWEKAGDEQPIRFYAMDGSELTVNTGNSYIGIIGNGRTLEFSAE